MKVEKLIESNPITKKEVEQLEEIYQIDEVIYKVQPTQYKIVR